MAKPRILIVEDEPEMRSLLALELETSGYEVFLAEDGKKGFELAQGINPDLIISDVLMPEMDGNQLFKKLRTSDFGKDVPFIVLTARKQMADYFEAVGADGFLEKPFQPKDLLGKIEQALKKHTALKPSGKPGLDKRIQPGKKSPESRKDEIIIINEMTKERLSGEDFSPEPVPAGMSAQKKEEPRRPRPSQRKRILILENNMDAYHELQRILSEAGHAVTLVTDPHKCIAEANNVDPGLIILKNVFNKIDAEDLANKLKTLPRFRQTPIIIYENIGEKAVTVNSAGVKITTFVLSREGKEMARKMFEILTD